MYQCQFYVVNYLLLFIHFSRPFKNVSHLFYTVFPECLTIFTVFTSKSFSGSLPIFSLIMVWVFTMFLCPQNIPLSSHFPTDYVNGHFFPDCQVIIIAPSLHAKSIRLVKWLLWSLEWERLVTLFFSLQLSFCSLMVGPGLFLSFAGVYRISLTLGSLSADDLVCVSVFLVVWVEAPALGCAGSCVDCICS